MVPCTLVVCLHHSQGRVGQHCRTHPQFTRERTHTHTQWAVSSTLGRACVTPEPLNLGSAYAKSSPSTPLMLISATDQPLPQIMQHAERRGVQVTMGAVAAHGLRARLPTPLPRGTSRAPVGPHTPQVHHTTHALWCAHLPSRPCSAAPLRCTTWPLAGARGLQQTASSGPPCASPAGWCWRTCTWRAGTCPSCAAWCRHVGEGGPG